MKKFDEMQFVNPNLAGIDVGSRSHIVAVGEEKIQVKEYNVYHSGTKAILSYLKENQVTTVAMESTGNYWQNLFMSLQEASFKVLLVQGTQTKNIKTKTDIKDAQWIKNYTN